MTSLIVANLEKPLVDMGPNYGGAKGAASLLMSRQQSVSSGRAQPSANFPAPCPPSVVECKPSTLGRYTIAAGIAAAVHGLALLALLNYEPQANRAVSDPARPVMVGIMVQAPAPKSAPVEPAFPSPSSPPPAPQSAPRPVPPTLRPAQPAVTTAPATPRSIAVAPPTKTAGTSEMPAVAELPASQSNTQATAQPAPSTARQETPAQGDASEPPRYEAAYLENPQPPYPLMSRKLREEGIVRLLVLVSVEGRAVSMKIKVGSGFERLDQAARVAVQEWRFVPARRHGQNIEGWVDVPVRFQLEK